jgi:hypothetical protein
MGTSGGKAPGSKHLRLFRFVTERLGGVGRDPLRDQAILTTHHTTIDGSQLLKGALQTYRVLPLHGTTKSVEFWHSLLIGRK